MRQEVSYLRCQLDLIAKQMVAIPSITLNTKTSYHRETLHRGFTTQTTNEDIKSFDANDTSEHVDIDEDNHL